MVNDIFIHKFMNMPYKLMLKLREQNKFCWKMWKFAVSDATLIQTISQPIFLENVSNSWECEARSCSITNPYNFASGSVSFIFRCVNLDPNSFPLCILIPVPPPPDSDPDYKPCGIRSFLFWSPRPRLVYPMEHDT